MRDTLYNLLTAILVTTMSCLTLASSAQEASSEGYNKTITLSNFEDVNSSINENCFNKIGREFFLLEIDIADAKFFPPTMKLSQSVYKTRETIAIEDLKVEEFYYLLNHDMVYTGPVVSYNLKDYIFSATKRHGEGVIKSGQTLQLYTANIDDEYFTKIKALPFCRRQYNYCHGSISENGNLLVFASDMPGGQGGYDLYASVRVNGKWTNPVNLGPKVNSIDDELYPYYSADGFLYFSSDRFGGAGGSDIYVCERLDNGWSAAGNLGAPYNSKSHDYGFRLLNYEGYGTLTSDRSGGLGIDDIYTFRHFREEENRDLINALDNEENVNPEDDTLAALATNSNTTVINNYFNFQSPEAANVMNEDAMLVYYSVPSDFDNAIFKANEASYAKHLPIVGSGKMKVAELGTLQNTDDQIVQVMIKGYEDIYFSPDDGQEAFDFTFIPKGIKHMPGHVIFSDGQPVENIEVELKATDGSSTLKATTDLKGKFSSRVFGDKEYEVRLYNQGVQMLETFTFDPSKFDQLVVDMSMSRVQHDYILNAIGQIPQIEQSTAEIDLLRDDSDGGAVQEEAIEATFVEYDMTEDETVEEAVEVQYKEFDMGSDEGVGVAEVKSAETVPNKRYTGDEEGDFYVITGTFSSERRAIRRRDLMLSEGFEEVQILKVDGSPFYRVCVGAFQDLEISISRQDEALPTVDDTFILRKSPDLIQIVE